jgi:hypothetical protein
MATLSRGFDAVPYPELFLPLLVDFWRRRSRPGGKVSGAANGIVWTSIVFEILRERDRRGWKCKEVSNVDIRVTSRSTNQNA